MPPPCAPSKCSAHAPGFPKATRCAGVWLWVWIFLCLLGESASWGQVQRPQSAAVAAPLRPLSLITNLGQLRELSRVEADRGHPVRVAATVTLYDSQWDALFVHDGSAPTFVFRTNRSQAFRVGEVIEIVGRSRVGFTPSIEAFELRPTGQSGPLPILEATLEELISGRMDCQRVKVRSVIRSMYAEFDRLTLEFGEAGGRYEAHLANYTNRFLPTHLLDARVEITGVVGANLTSQSRAMGVRLYPVDLDSIRIIEPAVTNGFDRPSQSIDTVLFFNSAAGVGQRIKIEGVVTMASGLGRVFVQDETGGMGVLLSRSPLRRDPNGLYLNIPLPGHLEPGDRVEVLAYPALGRDFAPMLTEAWMRKLGKSVLPTPVRISAASALTGTNHARVIKIEGNLLAAESRSLPASTNSILTLSDNDVIFEAEVVGPSPPLRLASRLEMTGICVVEMDEWQQPRAFRLQLPGPHWIRVLHAPSRFGLQHALALAGAIGLILAGSNWILRRQVARHYQSVVEKDQINTALEKKVGDRTMELERANRQLRQAEQELKRALAMEKQLSELKSNFVSMVSHEFRTPLGIIGSSAEILVRYFGRLTEQQRAEHLEAIIKSVRRMASMMEDVLLLSRVDAGSVQFKPVALELGGFCRRLVDEVSSATHRTSPIRLAISPDLPSEIRADESLLRHILTNLLSNAVKYSPAAKPVDLRVISEGGQLVFEVADEGIGIPAVDLNRLFNAFYRGNNVGQVSGTGLGLVVVKRCCDLCDGSVTVRSEEGKGTVFTLRLPLLRGV
jgi:signal transduction histidine kinase